MPTIFVTAPPETAADLSRLLVEDRLAASVNRIDCTSTYRWEGEVVTDTEEILLVQTDSDRVAELVDVIEDEHPYEVPCIERFDEDVLVNAYERWREDVVL